MSRHKGFAAEGEAAHFLEKKGFAILERNFNAKCGEIDIIAKKSDTFHFVEVKSAPDYETAVNNITVSKLSKVIKTAELYMKTKNITCDYAIDVVIVFPGGIEHLENVTLN